VYLFLAGLQVLSLPPYVHEILARRQNNQVSGDIIGTGSDRDEQCASLKIGSARVNEGAGGWLAHPRWPGSTLSGRKRHRVGRPDVVTQALRYPRQLSDRAFSTPRSVLQPLAIRASQPHVGSKGRLIREVVAMCLAERR